MGPQRPDFSFQRGSSWTLKSWAPRLSSLVSNLPIYKMDLIEIICKFPVCIRHSQNLSFLLPLI